MSNVRIKRPDGTEIRNRRKVRLSKSAAQRWGEARERVLLLKALAPSEPEPSPTRKEVPTLGEFAPRFLAWAESERHKASGVAAKETTLRVHLIPLLGTRRLDAITNLDIQELKHRLKGRSAKTCNNTLTCLNTLLKRAVEWGVLETMPCTIKLLKLPESTRSFYDFEEFERLVSEAAQDWRAYLIVLLGGKQGCDSARCWHWSGVTSISSSVTS